VKQDDSGDNFSPLLYRSIVLFFAWEVGSEVFPGRTFALVFVFCVRDRVVLRRCLPESDPPYVREFWFVCVKESFFLERLLTPLNDFQGSFLEVGFFSSG